MKNVSIEGIDGQYENKSCNRIFIKLHIYENHDKNQSLKVC